MKTEDAAAEITDNRPDWFFPEWAANAPNNRAIRVRDTDSALGRLNLQTKKIGLKDLARMHGHLCDGLAISFVLLSRAFKALFEDGIVDRTDLNVVTKNGPCWVDVATFLTGARLNFQTLRIDASVGNGFIVERVSRRRAVRVALAPGTFPSELAELEGEIRARQARSLEISPGEIDEVESMQEALCKTILNADPENLVELEMLEDFRFQFADMFGIRGDILNKHVARS